MYNGKILKCPGCEKSVKNAIFGNTKKCLVLDLDNTCWGGVIGDDGLDGIVIGTETAVAESYSAFQQYAKALKRMGVTLAVCSKNDPRNAKEGFNHPDSILKQDDFTSFHANWDPKYQNIIAVAKDINIGIDSLVFIDDNPVERDIVSSQLPGVSVPETGSDIISFISHIDRNGYFEPVTLSSEDMNRNKYYEDNKKRLNVQAAFKSYDEFLSSLEMKAEIKSFSSNYKDPRHHRPKFNSKILHWMKNGEHELSGHMLGQYLAKIKYKARHYDVSPIGNKIEQYLTRIIHESP